MEISCEAMPKPIVTFVCENCGTQRPKWEGQCSSCKEWNTLVENSDSIATTGVRAWVSSQTSTLKSLSEVTFDDAPRLKMSLSEVNRVLGGGLVAGSVILIAGEPGVGKSTLLLQIADNIAREFGGALYVTGEESLTQVKVRAGRLGIAGERIQILQGAHLSDVITNLDNAQPSLAIIDSIQTMHTDDVSSGMGSISQIRECTQVLIQWAKVNEVPIIISGHVTKDGDIAGPRVLEHMVDVVLQLEGEGVSTWRQLRAVKNRFGSTNETGIFEMTDQGLLQVEDPSGMFLAERMHGAIGSAIVPIVEGTRSMIVEIQALTNRTSLPIPRRLATGVDNNRVLLVCAVLTRQLGLSLSDQDVIVNVTGGIKVSEPAVDLGVALAIASSFKNSPVAGDLAVVGEIGLSGEVRRVPNIERRFSEVQRLGLKGCLAPAKSIKHDEAYAVGVPVSTLREALTKVLP